MVHGFTRDNVDVAVAFADKADADGKPFPYTEWQEQLALSKGGVLLHAADPIWNREPIVEGVPSRHCNMSGHGCTTNGSCGDQGLPCNVPHLERQMPGIQ